MNSLCFPERIRRSRTVHFRPAGLPAHKHLVRRFVRAYSLRHLPSYGHLLHWFGMNDQQRWADAPQVEIFSREHDHLLRLDLSDFYQRIAYFVGGYHELDVIAAISACLRPGESFVDGGANIGLVTLHAAGIVGPTGRVDSFECNPRVLDRLKWHIETNQLTQVHLHPIGLGDEPAELTVRLPGLDNACAATLGAIPARYGAHCMEVGKTRVFPGDSVLPHDDYAPLTIKLDIEGFEVHALRGLPHNIDRRRPAIILEVNPEMLHHCGSTPMHILDLLWKQRGYHPFGLDLEGWAGGFHLKLHPLWSDEFAWEHDVLWVQRDSRHWERLAPLMQPRSNYWRINLKTFHEKRLKRWLKRLRWLGLGNLARWATTGNPHGGQAV